MFDELDTVVLIHDIAKYKLKNGDLGTVVHSYRGGRALEVEFVAASGKTIAVLTLNPEDIRPMASHEILHARGLASA